MSKFTKEIIDDYADKLLIGLTESENDLVLSEFEKLEKSMDIIANMPGLDKVLPMSYALDDFSFNLRNANLVENRLSKELLKNCLDTEDDLVSVPRVVG